MKDRVRESLFNLLGPAIRGMRVLDLFAGTGAVSFEALSRGASEAVLVERHFPTAQRARQTADELGASNQVTVATADAFYFIRRLNAEPSPPWLVIVCPPYALYDDRGDEMMSLVAQLIALAPAESRIVAETPLDFDTTKLPRPAEWTHREYPPARISILRVDKPAAAPFGPEHCHAVQSANDAAAVPAEEAASGLPEATFDLPAQRVLQPPQ